AVLDMSEQPGVDNGLAQDGRAVSIVPGDESAAQVPVRVVPVRPDRAVGAPDLERAAQLAGHAVSRDLFETAVAPSSIFAAAPEAFSRSFDQALSVDAEGIPVERDGRIVPVDEAVSRAAGDHRQAGE